MTRIRRLAVIILLSGCAFEGPSPSGDELTVEENAARASEETADRGEVPASLRAVYVRARQAEGANDVRFHATRESGVLLARGGVAAGVTARFDRRGVALASELTEARLETRSIRCDAVRVPAMQSAPRIGAEPHRVEIDRARGPLQATEWFESGPLGIEQGFDVTAERCDELAIELAVHGADVELAGGGVRLASERGALRYADLFAMDASGRALPARMTVEDGLIQLAVTTRGAAWPVVIDPLVYVEDEVVGPVGSGDGGSSDNFGRRVALSGDTALVGAPGDAVGGTYFQGSAYVFTRSAGVWTMQAKLVAEDGTMDDRFGTAVALVGDVALIGAPLDDVGATADRGSVYVFRRSGTAWSQEAQLLATDGAAGDALGSAITFSGDTALIGAPGRASDRGAVYVFALSGATWTEEARLLASDGAAADHFGFSVALSGDNALIGAYGNTVAAANCGSAYVFTRSGASWTEQARLTASDAAANDLFGFSVAISGDTALIGASGVLGNMGAAYVFVRSGATWTQQERIGSMGVGFGRSVALSGDVALVAAPFATIDSRTNQGAVWVYVRAGTAWSQRARLTPVAGAADGGYGSSVALAGDTVLLGSSRFPGSVVVFTMPSSTWVEEAELSSGIGTQNALFGTSVAISGDTAIVGAPEDEASQGSAYVFARSGGLWALQAKLRRPDGGVSGAGFGLSVALAGETAFVGAPGYANRGAVYVFTRTGAIWTHTGSLASPSPSEGARFGCSVAASSNAVVIGEVGRNRAWVFRAGPGGWGSPVMLPRATPVGSFVLGFGGSVAIAGDRALVGAWGERVGANVEQGAAYVFRRSGTAWTQEGRLLAFDGAADDEFGRSVAISGDTALVGAALHGATNDGAAYVFTWTGAFWTQQARLIAGDPAGTGMRFGSSVALSVDTALVGAELHGAPGALGRGAVYLFTRGGGVWAQQARFEAADGMARGQFGASVAFSEPDILIGAPRADGPAPLGNPDEGRAHFGRLGATAGTPCGSASLCTSGFCVDGVCCESACGGGASDCQACASALTGVADGTCAPLTSALAGTVVCRAAAGACDVEERCTSASTACPGDTFLPAGTACASATCADGIETPAAACDGAGASCVTTSRDCAPTVCGATACLASCAGDGDCVAGFYCVVGACAPLSARGTACAEDRQCATGDCVDGFCCEGACVGRCASCGEPGLEGTCVAVTGAPRGARAPCAGDGSACDGACGGVDPTECVYPGAGTVCRSANCTEGVATLAASCDGAGACPAASTMACAPYACGPTACAGACAAGSPCEDGFVCVAGTCVVPLVNGAACTAGAACVSGSCVDGVCCESACGGQCESCGEPGLEGSCVTVSGTPRGARAACTGEGSACAGTCDGTDSAACAYPSAGSACGERGACDGAGTCVEPPSDGGAPGRDAGMASDDAGMRSQDASTGVDAGRDASTLADAGDPPGTRGGCGCRVQDARDRSSAPWAWMALAGAVVLGRRRTRRGRPADRRSAL